MSVHFDTLNNKYISTKIRAALNLLLQIFFCFCVFLFVFSPRVNLFGGLHMGMFAVLIVFVLGFKNVLRGILNLKNILLFLFFVSLGLYHALMAAIYGNDGFYFLSISVSVCISILFGFVFFGLLDTNKRDRDELIFTLIKLIIYAVFVNSIIIIVEFIYPEVKSIVESILINDPSANIDYAEHAFRLRGFSAAGGASLSIVNAAAVWLCVSLAIKKRISSFYTLIIIFVICASNIFTGRTGLSFSLLFASVYLLYLCNEMIHSIFSGGKSIFNSLSLVLFVAVVGFFLQDVKLDSEITSWAFEWVDDILAGRIESSSSVNLLSMLYIPNNVFHLMFGIGFFEGFSTIYPRTDSGYLKTVLSIGLVFAFFLYVTIFNLIYRTARLNRDLRLMIYPLIIFFLIVEIKEPYIYQNYASRAMFLLVGAYFYISDLQQKVSMVTGVSDVIGHIPSNLP